jgi:3-phosphoshikimate 1-carboxyvinyltransferase
MKLISQRSRLRGSVCIPASKSHTIRAVAIGSMATGTSIVRNPLVSSDTLSAVTCFQGLGAEIDTEDPIRWTIRGTGGAVSIPKEPIDVGNSGTTLPFGMACAALLAGPGRIHFTGDHQIQRRPVGPLMHSLLDLGTRSEAERNNGCAPLWVEGSLKGGTTSIECLTSQYLSALLIACPMAPHDTTIEVPLLNEPDYVQMTLDWIDRQNIQYQREEFRQFRIRGGQRYTAFDTAIPADFSSATFFFCAGAVLDADITLRGLDFTDSQPDNAVVEYLQRMGADIQNEPDGIRVRGSRLNGVHIDMNRTPDALPAMAVTGAFAGGQTRLDNVPQARRKETDRIRCMAEELKKLEVRVDELDDGLIIYESGRIQAASLRGHGDHRIVMALSLMGLASEDPIEIDTAEAIAVTFPDFVGLMQGLGAKMETRD